MDGLGLVERELLAAGSTGDRPQEVDGVEFDFGPVLFVDAPIGVDDVEVVAVPASGQRGVGVLAGAGVVEEDEAAVDGGALGFVDRGGVPVGEMAGLGVVERNPEPFAADRRRSSTLAGSRSIWSMAPRVPLSTPIR